MIPEEFFADRPDAFAMFERVHEVCEELGPVEVRVTRSQVAFRRAHGFAFLVREPADVDDEVVAWLAEAADRAG